MHIHPTEKKMTSHTAGCRHLLLASNIADLMQWVWLAIAQALYFHFLDSCNGTTRACSNVCLCWCPDTYTSIRYCYNFHALMSIGVGFVGVQTDFLQLLLTQTSVTCTSLDSSRWVVYSGIKCSGWADHIRSFQSSLKQMYFLRLPRDW